MSKLKTIEKKGQEYTYTTLEKGDENSRGLGSINFEDRYQQQCSLQDSSLATEAAIWLGIDNSGPHIEGPKGTRNEVFSGRMHLTQSMVQQLLPYLTEFANTGKYIANMKIKKSSNK